MKKTQGRVIELIPYQKRIKEYHDYHKDKKVQLVRKVTAGDNVAILVRVTDEDGKQYSCLDLVKSYVSEINHCPQDEAREEEMIAEFMEEWK